MANDEVGLQSAEKIKEFLEKSRADREKLLTQQNALGQRQNELNQQNQELVRRLVQLDGEIAAYSRAVTFLETGM